MAKEKTVTYKDYVFKREVDGSYHISKGGVKIDNVKACLRNIANNIGFEFNPDWNQRQLASNVIKAIEATGSPASNVENQETAIKCKTRILEDFSIHDMTDDWRITFFNDNFELLDEDTVANLKVGLVEYLKTISYTIDEGATKLSDEFKLEVEGQTVVTVDQYNFPGVGETIVEDVEKTLGAILTFAKNKGVNVVVCLSLFGVNVGNVIAAFECASLVKGESSCFEFIVYQRDDEDGEWEYVDVNDEDQVYDIDTIVEALSDFCSDNFTGDPFDHDDKGEQTDKGEDQFEKLSNLIGKTVFGDSFKPTDFCSNY